MDRVTFKINCVEHSVGCEVSSDVTLVDYIRNTLELRGTKYMCREAGCGACIVAVVKCPGAPVQAVNSCVVSVTSCHGWEITTIENLGNKKIGYHPIQKQLAKCNGSQCGHCTPGWVMAMYSLLQNKNKLTMLEIENSFGSNICRCTGYRPIMDALKRFAKDSPSPITDIEDLHICDKTGKRCSTDCLDSDWCFIPNSTVENKSINILLKDGRRWYTVYDVVSVFQILQKEKTDSYMLVAGNTAKVPYPINEYPEVMIDISEVAELKGYNLDQNLIVGAGSTLTELLDILQLVVSRDGFSYLQKLCDHIQLVAHIPVRNIGTIAGNLMIKHTHNDFPSDIFLLLELIGAQLTLLSYSGSEIVTMQRFLNVNMTRKIIRNVMLPPLNDQHKLVTFKIMPRCQNVRAIVNAGYLYRLNKHNKVLNARIVYGNLSPKFNRALKTEQHLIGKDLFSNETVQSSLIVLKGELVVQENPPEASAAFRTLLALRLFFKALLVLCPVSILHPRSRSGALNLHESRSVSRGRQVYDTNPSLWPLNQPLEKVEALIQCSGEALYTEDLPPYPYEVSAAFVTSTVCVGEIVSIDPSEALKQPGVLAFYTAKDIPGENSFTPNNIIFYIAYEEVLCSGSVKFYDQPLGIIVAVTQHIADRVAKLVKVQYKNVRKPVTDIRLTVSDPNRQNILHTSVDATDRGTDVVKVLNNSTVIGGQYHFTMETVVCIANPVEDGLEVYMTTQWINATQAMIASALKMEASRITVHVLRIGGGFGIKITRSIQCAVACCLVAAKLNRPCRLIQTMTTNTKVMGKRLPYLTNFEVGVNNCGVIQYLNMNVNEDNGYMVNEDFFTISIDAIYNCYDNARWSYKCFNSTTDTAKNSWCRAPGTLDHIAMAELIMEKISYELSLDPVEVRLANLNTTQYGDLNELVETIKVNGEYEKRRQEVDNFNAANRWKKRGLRFCFLRWTPISAGTFNVIMSVYYGDGSVAITHGGVEMGQGINTTAVQICAYLLNIPVHKIKIKGSNTVATANCFVTGGSFTTGCIGICVRKCCEQLLARLKPLRDEMGKPTWEQLVKKAFDNNMDLQARGTYSATEFVSYNVFGCTLAEVEIDILTGESEVRRIDLIEDVGLSVNPEIDIGQIEGAFVMGQGLWTCEQLVYDQNTGELLTDRAWNYHVPQARDIAQDFRVYLRKKSFGPAQVMGSKCVGEPPICMSFVVPCAIREALTSARFDSGIPTTQWFQIDGPYSVESIGMAAAIRTEDLKLY